MREQALDQLGTMRDERPIVDKDATNAQNLSLDDNAVTASQMEGTLKWDQNKVTATTSVDDVYALSINKNST